MSESNHRVPMSAIDEAVEAYEEARNRDGDADLEAFLPSRDHRSYLAILCELVRVDLEYSYEDNRARSIEEYEQRFPELFRDPGHAREIAFEDFRLRTLTGGSPSVNEYRDRFGVELSDSTLPAGRSCGTSNDAAHASETGHWLAPVTNDPVADERDVIVDGLSHYDRQPYGDRTPGQTPFPCALDSSAFQELDDKNSAPDIDPRDRRRLTDNRRRAHGQSFRDATTA